VNQVTHLGGWVTDSSFKVTTGTVTVELVDAGVDSTTANRNAHDAAAQVRLTCNPG
jgi:hypothetical protein